MTTAGHVMHAESQDKSIIGPQEIRGSPEARHMAMLVSCQLLSSGLADSAQGSLRKAGNSMLGGAAYHPPVHTLVTIAMYTNSSHSHSHRHITASAISHCLSVCSHAAVLPAC